MARKTCKFYVVPKSKLSSDDWRELGLMMRDLQNQERDWLDDIEEKQQRARGVFKARTIWHEMTVKEVKVCFKCDNLIIVARDPTDQKIIGFCAVEKKPSLGWATCDSLFVKKEWRGRGTASTFLEIALEKVKHDGLDSLDLRVSTKNKAAQALYKKLGFSRTAYQMEKWVA